jgi:putative DNA methylase
MRVASSQNKKLIEVALPLEAINKACVEDKNRKTGHIRNLHKWFAPMPLPAWRAVLFASLVDDPGNYLPEDKAEIERRRLFEIIEQTLPFEAIHNRHILDIAHAEIRRSVGDSLPTIADPFCGGGSTVVEAQRLGLPSFASDLNPLPVLITTMLTAIPPFVVDRQAVNPRDRGQLIASSKGLSGFIADVRYYAEIIRSKAYEKIGHLYPEGPNKSKVIAWRWARTVASPDPQFKRAHTPLVSDWVLSRKKGMNAWIDPVVNISSRDIEYHIRSAGNPPPGTTGRTAAHCLFSKLPIPLPYIRDEGKAGRLGLHMLSFISVGDDGSGPGRRKIYFESPTPSQIKAARDVNPDWEPETIMPDQALGFRVQEYGFSKFADLFTQRQIVALETFATLVKEVHGVVISDALEAGYNPDDSPLNEGGKGARAYADSVVTMLGLCVGKLAQSNNALVRWYVDSRNGAGQALPIFDRQTISMMWDFVEVNPFGGSVGDWSQQINTSLRALDLVNPYGPAAKVRQLDARALDSIELKDLVVATDPPYFANIGYADLSDFFYIWLRRALNNVHQSLFSTLATPKASELIATPFRHDGNMNDAKEYFRKGFREVFSKAAKLQRPDIPINIIYAYKQEEENDEGSSSTGWDAMLEGLIDAGLSVVGTWPLRTNRATRMRGIGSNALASSIVVVCRPRQENASLATRREFLSALKNELPIALKKLQHGNIAPVDLAQAAIGPGMGVFSRYSKVVESDGSPMSVRTALQLINQSLDEVLAEQESEYDAETRWALAWFEQNGMGEGLYGIAETLSKAKNTSVSGMDEAGVTTSKAGKVRLLGRDELPDNWNPTTDRRLTAWEVTQYLIRALDTGGEQAAAALLTQVGGMGDVARDLAYRLYTTSERKGWTQEALAYNSLVVAWPEISRLARAQPAQTSGTLF